jgi:hypothetical protein
MLSPVRAPPFPLADCLSARVGTALENALLEHGESRDELRAAVEACVESLKAQGMTAEGVIVTIKAVMRHIASGVTSTAKRQHSFIAIDYFNDDVVRWCVAWYFAEST